jgi:hypothetical protein
LLGGLPAFIFIVGANRMELRRSPNPLRYFPRRHLKRELAGAPSLGIGTHWLSVVVMILNAGPVNHFEDVSIVRFTGYKPGTE